MSNLGNPYSGEAFCTEVEPNAYAPEDCKATVRRVGDFCYIGPTKKLWRKMSKAEKEWAQEQIEKQKGKGSKFIRGKK